MIEVKEAQQNLLNKTIPNPVLKLPLEKAMGRILAEDVYSPMDMPAFPQSAMDGFAVRYGDLKKKPLKLKGEIKAGDHPKEALQPGEAIRIFTGAEVPKGADTVIMQEYAQISDQEVLLFPNGTIEGANIRNVGDQIRTGDLALSKGANLSPGAIGFLASMGINLVSVYRNPVIGIVVTGNEIIPPGETIQGGKVYECNSYSLKAALRSIDVTDVKTAHVGDNYQDITAKLSQFLNEVDILLVTGGISVGKHDLVRAAIEELNVNEQFYKVAQKPGKPLFAGKSPKGKWVFGLPGNPGAVLNCFYEYVYPVIQKQRGSKDVFLPVENRKLQKPVQKKTGRAYFLKGRLNADKGVAPLEGQESFMLKAFAEADCLIYLPSEKTRFSTDETVEVHRLPIKR